jgi:OmcA/MtrC family decaheme c-type cytochrome
MGQLSKSILLILASIGILIAGSFESLQSLYKLGYETFSKKSFLSAEERDFIRPGLHAEVLGTEVSEDGSVSVTVRLTDDLGAALDRNGVQTPGPISASYILGVIPEAGGQYVSYTNRTVTSPTTSITAIQPSTDSGGTLEDLGDGTYRYTFAAKLPEDDDPEATHTVGMYFRRDLRDYGLDREVVNEVVHFLPSGGPVVNIRDISRTESCNNCHDPLAFHGGSRQKMELCIMCHTDNVIDPDTGNSVDMKVMIHKVHMSKDLPSVQAGTPYQIIGNRGSINDFSAITFPRDIRDCKSCHSDDVAQAQAWFTNPTRETCGSCHDDVNFATGENHVNLAQTSDNQCANCHFPLGELEFDASIIGAHTVPSRSMQLEGINIEIHSVTNSGPGESPTVDFTVTNNAGETIDVATLSFSLIIAGPNTDFTFLVRESANTASANADGLYSYTFDATLPEDATGSFTLGAESNRTVLLNQGTTKERSYRETAENPVFYFAVTDPTPVPRRMLVSESKCENCHMRIELHGGNRHNPQYCVTCHQPGADDAVVRPPELMPARTIDFKTLIHRIHKGEELLDDYTIFGFRGSLHNYNEVLYPGDLRNCEACHESGAWAVPVAGIVDTLDSSEFYSPMPPNSAACLGCHDSVSAAAHTYLNTAPFGESCAVCHGEGAEFAVSKVHAR